MESLTKSRSGDSKNRNRDIDIRNLMSGMSPLNLHGLSSSDAKKLKEHQEMMENLHSKFSPELFGRQHDDRGKSHSAASDLMEKLLKRSAPVEQSLPSSERPSKRAKESSPIPVPLPVPAMSKLFGNGIAAASASSLEFPATMDLSERKESDGAVPLTKSKSTERSSKTPEMAAPPPPHDDAEKSASDEATGRDEIKSTKSESDTGEHASDTGEATEPMELKVDPPTSESAASGSPQPSPSSADKDESANKKRKPRNKKNPAVLPEDAVEKKNLRSSAGRAAAAAAARIARAAAAAQDEQTDLKKDDDTSAAL